jgi:hypothetical protein
MRVMRVCFAMFALAACGRLDFATRDDARLDDAGRDTALDSSPIVAMFEAETAILTAPFTIGLDAAASGGMFLTDGNGTGLTGPGGALYHFTVPHAGTYYIWSRTYTVDTATDSFFLAVDGGTPLNYDTSSCVHTPAWLWHAVHEDLSNCPTLDPPLALMLAAGAHSLELTSREGGSAIDAMIVTDDTTFVPADF